MTGILALGCVALTTACVEYASRRSFGSTRRLVGDESEYLARARASDPFGPEPFLRVPVLPALARLAGDESRLRRCLALLAVATATLTAGAALLTGGATTAVICGLLFALLPDRIILSQHIWPDVLLSFWHAVLLLALSWTAFDGPLPGWVIGLVLAGTCMTRIDGLGVLAALSVLAGVAAPTPATFLGLWAPSALALAAWSLRNGLRYGLPWPDTTLWFNVKVLEREQQSRDAPLTDDVVPRAFAEWIRSDAAQRASQFRRDAREIAGRPGVWCRRFLRRCWQMLGADSFAIEKLLDRESGAYPASSPSVRRLFVQLLRVSFPLLAALAVANTVLGTVAPRWLMAPAAAVFVTACLVHARTRYRYALLPYLCLGASWGVQNLALDWRALLLAACLAALMLAAPPRSERSRAEG